MKFAIVAGQRREPIPLLSGTCPTCGSPMTPKCGRIRMHHWAHSAARSCDSWWENETPWHRDWKNQFPRDWQEVVHRAADDERHVADIKTPEKRVIEFQHSRLDPRERTARENFYRNMVWVVHGRARDRETAMAALQATTLPGVYRVAAGVSRLLSRWAGSSAPVYIDFDDAGDIGQGALGRGTAGANGSVYLAAWSKTEFATGLRCGSAIVDDCTSVMRDAVHHLERQTRQQRAPTAFHRYLARRDRSRPRF